MGRQSIDTVFVLPPRPKGVAPGRWLYDALRSAILDGRLRAGARLPATRALAAEYGVARGTVVGVFEQLASEGYLEARVGSGTRVRAVLPDRLLQATRTPVTSRREAPARRISGFAKRAQLMRPLNLGPARAFRANQPALDLFPARLWAQVAGRRLRRSSSELLAGSDPLGFLPLREQVAAYLTTSRGASCTPERVAIVPGGQAAIDVIARLLIEPGDVVAVENPGYIGAVRLFEAYGARLVPADVDDEGIVVDALKRTRARLVYVTPAHQFPLCVSMPLARRLALLEWARSRNALIFEDDYDSEYRYEGRPLPAMQGLDDAGCVIFSGSFSKTLFPGLRLAYVVVPDDLVDPLAAVLSLMNRHAQMLDQAVLADFMEAGHFGRHLRRMREVYAQRLGVLLAAAKDQLDGMLTVSDVEAGLQTVGWLAPGFTGGDVVAAAARHDVQLLAISRFALTSYPREGLQIGFAAVDEKEIRRGVDVLELVLRRLRRRRR